LPPLAVAGRVFDEPLPQRAPRRAETAAAPTLTLDTLNTGDPRLQAAIDRARRMLGRDIPILIQGESGAGKEMFAKGYHNSGPRRDQAFVALNCASIPETLIESELFGYQGGAFTGARKEGAPGKIQQAHGGTLFLDEIGDMPLNLQARLLRVLQERCVTSLGSTRSIQVDISLVCATHRKLREEVARGTFREDLYYRLNGMSVTLPALRERTDIRSMVAKLAAVEIAARGGPVKFSEGALQAIEGYSWPGNIRQLFNVIRVAIALLDDDETLITESHLPEELFESSPLAATSSAPAYDPWAAAPLEGANSMDAISRQAAMRALEAAGGNISSAARQLGISRNTLYRKLGRM
jgi:transcriptional regulator with PAS, ATPase and Fis domain